MEAALLPFTAPVHSSHSGSHSQLSFAALSHSSHSQAREQNSVVTAVALTGVVLGILLLLAALYVVNRARLILARERLALDEKTVRDAIESMQKLAFPMVLVPAEVFASCGEMLMHEHLRDSGKLVVLNTYAEIKEHKKRRKIIFLSHQV